MKYTINPTILLIPPALKSNPYPKLFSGNPHTTAKIKEIVNINSKNQQSNLDRLVIFYSIYRLISNLSLGKTKG